MLEKVRGYIEDNRMLEKGDRVVIGVSGGADSTALLEVLATLKEEYLLSLYVVHINHGIRNEAMEDAEYVRSLCDKHGLPFYLYEEDIPAMAKREHLSEEEAGRKYRYHCFAGVMAETGASKLAVAHHMDDQAETVLFHLVRGTDLAGIAGMAPISVMSEMFVANINDTGIAKENEDNYVIIRPLLNTRKNEIIKWLLEQGITWQEDITNGDDHYARNRIRNQIIDELSMVNERATEHIIYFSEKAASYDRYIKRQALSFIHKEVEVCCTECTGEASYRWIADFKDENDNGRLIKLRVRREHLLSEDKVLADRVLYELLIRIAGAKKDIEREHVEALYELLSKQSGKRLMFPYRVTAYVSYEWLVLEKIMLQESADDKVVSGDGISVDIRNLSYDNNLSIKISDKEKILLRLVKLKNFFENPEKFEKNYTKYFDCDTIGNTLYIRYPEPEDYLICNREGHRKKLSKYFKDIKLPAEERKNCMLLAKDSEVLWVIGRRRCEAHLVKADTQRILMVEYEHS